MINVVEQHTQAKSTTTPSEDAVVVTSSYAAVIDGATPKTSFRYPTGETPGQLAARLLSDAIRQLPPTADAITATRCLTEALHQEGVAPSDRPIASCAIYSDYRHEVWMLGDCQYATISKEGTLRHHSNEKRIDQLLAEWRRAVVHSYLSRGLMTEEQLLANDPGRCIIQPHITRQVRYQNIETQHRLAYCMLDGEAVPEQLIRVDKVPHDTCRLILATDGYPELLETLDATEARLSELLQRDPLCIGPLLGTKGIKPGNDSYDDRTFLSCIIHAGIDNGQ